jgi:hypothetical protein
MGHRIFSDTYPCERDLCLGIIRSRCREASGLQWAFSLRRKAQTERGE